MKMNGSHGVQELRPNRTAGLLRNRNRVAYSIQVVFYSASFTVVAWAFIVPAVFCSATFRKTLTTAFAEQLSVSTGVSVEFKLKHRGERPLAVPANVNHIPSRLPRTIMLPTQSRKFGMVYDIIIHSFRGRLPGGGQGFRVVFRGWERGHRRCMMPLRFSDPGGGVLRSRSRFPGQRRSHR
jgi:hypothetical protein